MVLNRFDPERCILVFSTDQSPLWRNPHLEHESVIGCDDRQQFIVGKVDIVLPLDERVHLAKIHPQPSVEARRLHLVPGLFTMLPPSEQARDASGNPDLFRVQVRQIGSTRNRS